MLSRDILGIYLPAAYLMLGLSNLIVCNCVSAPIPTDVTGSSGSSMICFFYYLFHLLLWVPVGIVLVVVQWFLYRTSTIDPSKVFNQAPSSDKVRHLVCVLIGGFLVLASTITLRDIAASLSIFVMSLIVSIAPALIFFS
jgi:hypothetical protein